MIATALRQDIHFSKMIPDEFSKDTRDYVLTLVNSLTGAEFEGFIQAIELALANE